MQQINLYKAEFQPNREPLRSIHMLWGLAVFVVLLVAVTLMSSQANREREQTLLDNRAKLVELKLQITQLEQQRPKNNLAELDSEILGLQQDLERRNQIFTIIANKDMGNNAGFSAHLQALARQSLEGVSLSVFSLQRGGNYTEFAGQTRAAELIPLYVQGLRSEPAFIHSAFGVLNIAPAKNSPNLFEFSLARSLQQTTAVNDKTAVQKLLERNKAARGDH